MGVKKKQQHQPVNRFKQKGAVLDYELDGNPFIADPPAYASQKNYFEVRTSAGGRKGQFKIKS